MRSTTYLLVAIFVLHARAATIFNSIAPGLERKLPRMLLEETKFNTKNVSSEQESIVPANTVKDVEKNLHTIQVIEDIPVKVIVGDVEPSVRTNSEEKDIAYEGLEEDIVRPLVKTPGLSQLQDHATPNIEHHNKHEISSSYVEQSIQETALTLRQGFQEVTDGIQNWYGNNDQVTKLQFTIKNLEQNFSIQVQKLNETLQRIAKSKLVQPLENEAKTRASLQNLETRLDILRNNFNAGMKTLTEGVHVVSSLRTDGEGAAGDEATSSLSAPTPSPGFMSPFVILVSLFSNLQSSVSSEMANVAQTMNNLMSNSTGWNLNFLPVAGNGASLIDIQTETGTMSPRPSPGQNLLNSSILSPGQQNQMAQPTQSNQTAQPTQQNQTAQPTQSPRPAQPTQPTQPAQTTQATQPAQPVFSGPFSAIQNIPSQILQNIQNFIKKPYQPATKLAEGSSAAPASNQAGNNEDPMTPTQLTESKPESEKKSEAAKQPEFDKIPGPVTGPIRQILGDNPMMQGLVGALQRIQTSTNIPEKQRDRFAKNETDQEKGGQIFVVGHRPGSGGSGDDNDIVGGLKSEVEENKETRTEQKTEDVPSYRNICYD